MREPLQAFSLSLHPEKTRLLQRGATARSQRFFASAAKEDRNSGLVPVAAEIDQGKLRQNDRRCGGSESGGAIVP